MALPPQPIVTSLLQKILSEQAMNLPGVQFLEEFRPTNTQEKPMKKKRIQLQLDEELAGELRSVLDLHKLTWDQWGAQAARIFAQDGLSGTWPDKNVLEQHLVTTQRFSPGEQSYTTIDVVELIMGIFKRWGQQQGPVWDAINAGEPQRRRYIEQLLAGEASLDPPPKPPRTRAKAWIDYSEDA